MLIYSNSFNSIGFAAAVADVTLEEIIMTEAMHGYHLFFFIVALFDAFATV